MADTVYEEKFKDGYVSFTRFWCNGEDWIQINTKNEYTSLPFTEFIRAYNLIAESVYKTKDAWWHDISKGVKK